MARRWSSRFTARRRSWWARIWRIPRAPSCASACCCASVLANRKPHAIERALDAVLAEGLRTADIAEPGCAVVSGSQFTAHVREQIRQQIREQTRDQTRARAADAKPQGA